MEHESVPRPRAEADRAETAGAIEQLLLDWQRTADAECLRTLIAKTAPLIGRFSHALLRRQGIADPAATDEVVSLVHDHLRRLPGVSPGERAVALFAPPPELRPCTGDPGEAYIIWLVRDRTRDVARARRRQACHATLFSTLDRLDATRLEQSTAAAESRSLGERCDRLREAVDRLPPRERSVIELLLAGHSQVTIADTMHVCAGTVSRLRSRAIAALRDLLTD